MNSIHNGRVNIKSQDTNKLFGMFDKIPASQCVSFRNATDGIWIETKLSQAFFSLQNIRILQNGIRSGVYNKSNQQYIVGEQDCDALKVVMRSVYLQHSANQPFDIRKQIIELNKIVLDYCVKQVYSEAQGYLKYMHDASTLVVPISHPIMADNTDRQLEFKTWF